MNVPLLSVQDACVTYRTRGGSGSLTAVDRVSFDLEAGGSLGIVGESGSGKTTLVSAVIGTVALTGGRILLDGAPPTRRSRRRMQMVYQDPVSSLNPRMRIGSMLSEIVAAHRPGIQRSARRDRVAELIELAGLPQAVASRRPHEISGGQRQRAGIARALAAEPALLILDEAVAALDLSVQAAVLRTIRSLQESLGFALLFISHDLSVVRHTCDDVLVMTAGRIVESGTVDDVFGSPAHDYTRRLLASTPEIGAGGRAITGSSSTTH
ncbi:ABC transporter ATP-binding protein [Microbacterium tumbae]